MHQDEKKDDDHDFNQPKERKALMQKLFNLPFQTYPGPTFRTSQTMREKESHQIDDEFNEVIF
jgi:hypothetical protein